MRDACARVSEIVGRIYLIDRTRSCAYRLAPKFPRLARALHVEGPRLRAGLGATRELQARRRRREQRCHLVHRQRALGGRGENRVSLTFRFENYGLLLYA